MKYIKVIYNNEEILYKKTKEVSVKYNISIQHIHNLLNKKNNKDSMIIDNQLLKIEYYDDGLPELSDKEKRKIYNNTAYLKKKIKKIDEIEEKNN